MDLKPPRTRRQIAADIEMHVQLRQELRRLAYEYVMADTRPIFIGADGIHRIGPLLPDTLRDALAAEETALFVLQMDYHNTPETDHSCACYSGHDPDCPECVRMKAAGREKYTTRKIDVDTCS